MGAISRVPINFFDYKVKTGEFNLVLEHGSSLLNLLGKMETNKFSIKLRKGKIFCVVFELYFVELLPYGMRSKK